MVYIDSSEKNWPVYRGMIDGTQYMLRYDEDDSTDEVYEAEQGGHKEDKKRKLKLNKHIKGHELPECCYMQSQNIIAAPDLFEMIAFVLRTMGVDNFEIDQEYFKLSFEFFRLITPPEYENEDYCLEDQHDLYFDSDNDNTDNYNQYY